jgi:hypothetical protein
VPAEPTRFGEVLAPRIYRREKPSDPLIGVLQAALRMLSSIRNQCRALSAG